jgi:hypothetical protein
LKADPYDPSLHFKKVDNFWSARVGIHHRVLGVEVEDGVLGFGSAPTRNTIRRRVRSIAPFACPLAIAPNKRRNSQQQQQAPFAQDTVRMYTVKIRMVFDWDAPT